MYYIAPGTVGDFAIPHREQTLTFFFLSSRPKRAPLRRAWSHEEAVDFALQLLDEDPRLPDVALRDPDDGSILAGFFGRTT